MEAYLSSKTLCRPQTFNIQNIDGPPEDEDESAKRSGRRRGVEDEMDGAVKLVDKFVMNWKFAAKDDTEWREQASWQTPLWLLHFGNRWNATCLAKCVLHSDLIFSSSNHCLPLLGRIIQPIQPSRPGPAPCQTTLPPCASWRDTYSLSSPRTGRQSSSITNPTAMRHVMTWKSWTYRPRLRRRPHFYSLAHACLHLSS